MATLAPPAPTARDTRTAPPRGLLLVILISTFMTSLDFFIVNVAIPSMQLRLSASTAAIQWIVAGYGLALAATLITAGRIGDILGRRLVLALGLALFTLASTACGLAPGVDVLIAGRVAQGVGGALMTPQLLVLLQTCFLGRVQAKAFAMYGLTMGLGAVFGQLIGGVLIRADLFGLDWRACFLINLPVGLAALALVPRAVPESRAPQRPGLDNTGVLLVTAALLTLVLPLIEGRAQGWPLWTWLCLAASPVLFTVFGVHQHRQVRRGGHPIVHTGLFRSRTFSVGMLAQLVFWAGQGSFFLILALYLQQGRGLTALASGLVFVVIGGGYLATSTVAHLLAARMGRQVLSVGALLMALGLGLLWLAAGGAGGGHGSVAWLVPGLLVDGVGMGMLVAPLTSGMLSGVAPQLAGSASGVLSTAQQVAGALGIAVIGIVFYGGLGRAGTDFPHAFQLGLLTLALTELLLAGLVRLLPRGASAEAA
ncbi:MFS transporter [Streptacidiphilus sp. P02-A3a]|uniref:MFS transporter n=1 Tax=Streptacidiphilus sp. P02-A3a TaxID=2704468 RepID=UPI0015F9934D|nr:MFS transporter [Streptacidiphilus sp. P02-A3a]QMU69229.1 MFS transporter [Streptacidiphilus sp. P02-A3a]